MASTQEPPKDYPVLHIWPKTEHLLSLDPGCVAALLLLQLTIPNKFAVNYTNNPDLSPSGHLPYVTHGLHSVSGFESIAKYAAHLARDGGHDLDHSLSPTEKAQNAARIAHVESALGDLVAHAYFSLSANWTRQTRHAFASVLPIPYRFYVPDRIRASYKPRLEAAELWDVVGIEEEEEREKYHFSFRRPLKKTKKATEKLKFKENMQRKKVTEKAKDVLDIYSRLLGHHKFFYGFDHPTTLDIVFAAHIYMLRAHQPDPLLSKYINETYPHLIAHCDHVLHRAFPDPAVLPVPITHSQGFSIRSMLPRVPSAPPKEKKLDSAAWREQERKFKLMRWAFFGTAGLLFGSYLYFGNIIGMYAQTIQTVQAALQKEARAGAVEEGEDEEGEDEDDVLVLVDEDDEDDEL